MVRAFLLGLALAGIAGGVGSGAMYFHGKSVERAHWTEVVQGMLRRATEVADKAREEEAARVAALEAERAKIVKEKERELAKNRALARQLESDNQWLRDEIARFASGGSGEGDSLAAANARAATLGVLLGESMQLLREIAKDAEDISAELRSLQAWEGRVIESRDRALSLAGEDLPQSPQ